MNGEFIRFSILRMFCFYNVVKSVWKRNRKKNTGNNRQKIGESYRCDEKNTVQKYIKMTEYGARISRKKPLLSKKNKNKRRLWANKMVEMPLDYWKKVIFSDECRFSQFNNAYRTFVYRKKNRAYQAKRLVKYSDKKHVDYLPIRVIHKYFDFECIHLHLMFQIPFYE